MAKAKKEGKPKRNRKNLSKNLKRLENNRIALNKLITELNKQD
jgi:hypothetical protein